MYFYENLAAAFIVALVRATIFFLIPAATVTATAATLATLIFLIFLGIALVVFPFIIIVIFHKKLLF